MAYTSASNYGSLWQFLVKNGSLNPVKQDPSSYHAGTGSGTATKAVVSPIASTFSNISGMIKTFGSASFHWDVAFFIIGMIMVFAALSRSDVLVNQAASVGSAVPEVAA